jgi:membrane protease YdiL (CAAX protease family)
MGPKLPWSAVVMMGLTALSYRALSRMTSRQRMAPPRAQGLWPWVAAVAVAVCLVSSVLVGLRLARLPADAFASTIDMRALSRPMQAVRIAMAASVAAYFEELGLRGLIQGSLTRRYGSVRSVGVTTVMFYLLHLGHGWTHGGVVTVLAVALPILIGGVLLGALVSVTGSLGPSMVAHALADMVLLHLEWTGRHRLDSVAVSGIDSHFLWWTMTVGASSIACVIMLVRLASRTELRPGELRGGAAG